MTVNASQCRQSVVLECTVGRDNIWIHELPCQCVNNCYFLLSLESLDWSNEGFVRLNLKSNESGSS